MKRSAILLAGFLACGCSGDPKADQAAQKTTIPMGKIPPQVVKAAMKALPDVAFDSASQEGGVGQETFEIKGTDKKGKPREVKVARDGKVLSSTP